MQVVAELVGAVVLIWLLYEGAKAVLTSWRKKNAPPQTTTEQKNDE